MPQINLFQDNRIIDILIVDVDIYEQITNLGFVYQTPKIEHQMLLELKKRAKNSQISFPWLADLDTLIERVEPEHYLQL